MGGAGRSLVSNRPFLVAASANALDFLALSAFFLLPRYLKELGAGEAHIGLVMGSAGLVNVFATPLAGTLVDRVGSRTMLLFGSLLMAACSAGMAIPAGPGVGIVLLRMGQGLAFSSFFVAGASLVAEGSPEANRAQALGLYGVLALAATAIAPAVGEVLVAQSGFEALFLVAGACALVGAAISLLAPPVRPPTGTAPPATVFSLLRARRVLVPVALCGLLATGFGAALTFVSAMGVERDLPGVAPFFVGHVTASIGVRVLFGWLPDRIGHGRAAFPAALVLASGLALLAFSRGSATLAAAGLLFGSGHAVTYPSLQALVIGRAGAVSRGRALGVYSGAFAVGTMSSSFVYGVVAEHAGYTPMYLLAAGVVTAGALAFLALDRG